MYFCYNIVLTILSPFLVLFFILKKRSGEKLLLAWRFGLYNDKFTQVKQYTRRIWIHAASVGEINAIAPFIKLLREAHPDCWIGVSTMTVTGLETARAKLPEINDHFILPLDVPFSVNKVMRMVKPTLLITVETEIWPNLLKHAKKCGASVAMINGRISIRKIDLYLKFKLFFTKVLQNYDICSMILPIDADRIVSMGADPAKVTVNGNVKFDSLKFEISDKERDELPAMFNLSGREPVLVAGSTREGEEELIIKAFKKIRINFPDLILIIAPRHIQRSPEIRKIISEAGLQSVLKTELHTSSNMKPGTVIILNTIGELFKVYSLASIAFCGASLVPLGGQNPLEAAAWGKVVLYGPSMEDFLDAKKLLEEAGAGFEVQDYQELATRIITLLENLPLLIELGSKGQKAILAQQGSSARNLALIQNFLGERQKAKGER